jgi:biopolymer transport protein ExbB
MWMYFIKGGPIMWPLLACSIVALTIAIERLFYHRSIRVNHAVMRRLLETFRAGDVVAAANLAEKLAPPFRVVFVEGVRQAASPQLADLLEDIADQQTPQLERFLPLLATIASVATLLGFTGTVTGMIQAFEAIAAAGSVTPQTVSSGIAQALITTAAGLFIAIPTIIFHNYFVYRADRYVQILEHYLHEFLKARPS